MPQILPSRTVSRRVHRRQYCSGRALEILCKHAGTSSWRISCTAATRIPLIRPPASDVEWKRGQLLPRGVRRSRLPLHASMTQLASLLLLSLFSIGTVNDSSSRRAASDAPQPVPRRPGPHPAVPSLKPHPRPPKVVSLNSRLIAPGKFETVLPCGATTSVTVVQSAVCYRDSLV